MNKQKMARAPRESHPPQLHHVEVRKAENGGHIVTHHFDVTGGGEYHPPEDHVFAPSEGSEALAHVASNLGIEAKSAEASSEDGESERGKDSEAAEEGEKGE